MTTSDDSTSRSPAEVLEDHLEKALEGRVEEDLARNYAADVVVLMADGVHHGHDGVRELAALLQEQLPQSRFVYTATVVAGDVALLEWTARDDSGARVEDGVDSFVIRDGRIRAQTIHYTVDSASGQGPVPLER